MVRVSCRVRFNNYHLSRKSRTASYLAARHIWHDAGRYRRLYYAVLNARRRVRTCGAARHAMRAARRALASCVGVVRAATTTDAKTIAVRRERTRHRRRRRRRRAIYGRHETSRVRVASLRGDQLRIAPTDRTNERVSTCGQRRKSVVVVVVVSHAGADVSYCRLASRTA